VTIAKKAEESSAASDARLLRSKPMPAAFNPAMNRL